MTRYRKKPVEIDAHQWFANGDHPDDKQGEYRYDPIADEHFQRIEGAAVRFFRHPPVDPHTGNVSARDDAVSMGQMRHCDVPHPHNLPTCDRVMDKHGWIDTPEGGHTVCPGDWIITGIAGERYPCKPDIFTATYEPVEVDVPDPDSALPGDALRGEKP